MIQIFFIRSTLILFTRSIKYFFKKFLLDTCSFWGHWYPCFGILVTSPLGFKPEWAALFELCGGMRDIHSLRFTSGVTPLLVYIASIAASRFPHMCVSAEVGCRIWTTRPQRPSCVQLNVTPDCIHYKKAFQSNTKPSAYRQYGSHIAQVCRCLGWGL